MRSTLARPGATLARPARRVVSVPGSASGMGTSQAEASSSAPPFSSPPPPPPSAPQPPLAAMTCGSERGVIQGGGAAVALLSTGSSMRTELMLSSARDLTPSGDFISRDLAF